MLYLFNVIAVIFAGAASTVSAANVIANSIEASNLSKGLISFNTDNAKRGQNKPLSGLDPISSMLAVDHNHHNEIYFVSKLVTNNASSDQSIPPPHEAFTSEDHIHSIEKLENRNTAFMGTNLDASGPGWFIRN